MAVRPPPPLPKKLREILAGDAASLAPVASELGLSFPHSHEMDSSHVPSFFPPSPHQAA